MFIRLAYTSVAGMQEDVLIFHMVDVKVTDVLQKMGHLLGKHHMVYLYNEHGTIMKNRENVEYGRSYTLVRRSTV